MKKLIIFGFLILLPSACAPGAQEKLPSEGVSDQGIEVYDDISYGDSLGYLALPPGDGPYPAVILIHEWWGLNDGIKGFADLL